MPNPTDKLDSNYSGDLPLLYRRIFRVLAIALALITALDSRFQVTGDGPSYIEMGDAYFRGDWKMAINSYWSPLYAWLIVVPKHLFGLSLYYESLSIHLVNVLIFVFALFCFEFFLGNLIRGTSIFDREHFGTLPPWALRLIAYALFLYSAAYWLSTDIVTPDLLVEAIVLLAAGMILQIRTDNARWADFAKLGVILGFGYLIKAVLFPLAFVFLLSSFFAVTNPRRAFPRAAASFLLFCFMATPYIYVLSRAKGRLTYGDVGKIAYGTYVDGLPLAVHWQPSDTRFGTPLHPTRKIFDHPNVFEFAQPIGGSYPAWYDPAYWYAGVAPKFAPRIELTRLNQHLHYFVDLLGAQAEFVAGFFALLLIALRPTLFLRRWLREATVWAPAIVAFGAYSLIHIETRFLPGFLLITGLSLFAVLPIPDAALSRKVVWCISLAIAATVGFRVLWTAALQLGHIPTRTSVYWQVAQQLRDWGIRPGDKVASIGFTFDGYWAHLAQVTIVAEIPEGEAGTFWIATPETKSQVLALFAKYGAKAIVSNRVPQYTNPPGWTSIYGWTPYGYSFFFLRTIPGAAAP